MWHGEEAAQVRPEPFIVRLEAERAAVAHESLSKPAADLFFYGRACGFYAGLARAKQLFEELMVEDDQRRRNL